jgi:hypothetical protein
LWMPSASRPSTQKNTEIDRDQATSYISLARNEVAAWYESTTPAGKIQVYINLNFTRRESRHRPAGPLNAGRAAWSCMWHVQELCSLARWIGACLPPRAAAARIESERGQITAVSA